MNKYLGKENLSIDKTSFKPDSSERTKKGSLGRFYFRRNTADCTKQRAIKPKKESKAKEMTTFPQSLNTVTQMSNKNLDPVHERQSEQRTTIKKNIASEITSNESTPRIEEEEIIIHTLEGGYSEAIKKSFHDKNMFFGHAHTLITKF